MSAAGGGRDGTPPGANEGGGQEQNPRQPEEEMLAIELRDRELAGVGRIAGVQTGPELLVEKMSREKAGKPKGHVDVPGSDEQEEGRRSGRAQEKAQPGTPGGNE